MGRRQYALCRREGHRQPPLESAAELFAVTSWRDSQSEEPGFQDWLQTEREQFPLLACGVYARLLDQAQTAGRLEDALTAGL